MTYAENAAETEQRFISLVGFAQEDSKMFPFFPIHNDKQMMTPKLTQLYNKNKQMSRWLGVMLAWYFWALNTTMGCIKHLSPILGTKTLKLLATQKLVEEPPFQVSTFPKFDHYLVIQSDLSGMVKWPF